MTSAITSTTETTTSTSSSTTSGLSADYDMFIQLLVAQLQYQDPLDPTDATEFTNQLVQYSNLEQQIATNDKLDEVLSSLDTFGLSSGVGYMGHTVEAQGDTISVQDDGTVDAEWIYSLDEAAEEVTLTVTDEDGNVVWEGTGTTNEGRNTFTWDGTDSDGNVVEGGAYTLTVTATDSSGESIDSTTFVSGKVTGVSSVDGTTVLELGDMGITLDAVARLAS
ncbi:MAG: flagellar hook assembly protein FlgD [Magnetospirillum sp.]|nr:flagellar hook assembly protein FlgD [Magnetospirillum sp.]